MRVDLSPLFPVGIPVRKPVYHLFAVDEESPGEAFPGVFVHPEKQCRIGRIPAVAIKQGRVKKPGILGDDAARLPVEQPAPER
jgi:hypothetical protein